MSRPVVVTGAAGFIGGHLTRALAAKEVVVRAVDVEPDPHRFRLRSVRYSRVDVRDIRALRPVVSGSDTVYHLAAANGRANGNAETYRDVNVGAVIRLVRACAAAGVRRLVHVSTVGVHGHVTDPPAREESPVAPAGLADRTKLEGEQAALELGRQVGVEVVVLRPSWVYGPSCPRMGRLLRSVETGRFVYVGDGRNLLHPVFITDMVDALLLAGAAPSESVGRPYIVAGPRYIRLREMVETCARALDVGAPRLHLPDRIALAVGRATELAWNLARCEPPFSVQSLGFFRDDAAFDISAARRGLGFDPGVDLEEGVQRATEGRTRLIGT